MRVLWHNTWVMVSSALFLWPLESLIIVCQTLTGGDNTDNQATSTPGFPVLTWHYYGADKSGAFIVLFKFALRGFRLGFSDKLFGWWIWFNFSRYEIFRNLSSCLAICHLCLIFRELIRMSNRSCFTLNMSCHDVMFCHEMWKCSNSSCPNSPDNINCKFVLLRWLISGAKVLTTAWLQFPALCQLEISLKFNFSHKN